MAASYIQLGCLGAHQHPLLRLDALQGGIRHGGRLLDHHYIVCLLLQKLHSIASMLTRLVNRADHLLVCFFEGQGLPAEET